MGVTSIDSLTVEQEARFDEWADRWIEIGLRTGPADRERFESAVRDCYRYAGIPLPEVVVWVPSPLVMAFAAPTAAVVIEQLEAAERRVTAVRGAVDPAVGDAVGAAVRAAVADAVDDAVDPAAPPAVRDAVDAAVAGAVAGAVDVAVRGAVAGAVRLAVGPAVRAAVGDAVRDAVRAAVGDAVRDAVRDAVGDAVGGAVEGAVDGAVGDAVGGAVAGAVAGSWWHYIGGQFWDGGYRWGGAYTSFFREVCGLELKGDLWDRGRAYEETIQSGCWWWPHRRFVMVSERPLAIHRELVNPASPRGWGSHRLHCETGPAIVWPDGWGVWSIHGVRVPQQVVEAPETLTPEQILNEQNVEVRRVMIQRFGQERLIREADATLVSQDDYGKLWRIPFVSPAGRQFGEDDEPLVMVEIVCPSTSRIYFERVPPDMTTPREALAWQAGVTEGEYVLAVES